MGECDIEIELMITLVQEQPIIWDRTHELYKHKNETAKAWREICSILVEEFNTADEHEKTQICKSIHRKWTNMRDTWMKCVRKDAELRKSGSGKTMKKYIYHDRMLFLQKNYSQTSDAEGSLAGAMEIDSKQFMDDSNSQVFTLTFPQSPFDSECEMDVPLLITLVEDRPLIWDRTHPFYKHKKTTAETWKEICAILVDRYSSADEIERVQICRTVQRKWTNLRDTWKKYIRKEAGLKKSNRDRKNKKKYIYHDQMLFLQKNFQMSDTEANESCSQNFTDDSSDQAQPKVSTSKQIKKRKEDQLEDYEFEESSYRVEDNWNMTSPTSLNANDLDSNDSADDSIDPIFISNRTESTGKSSQLLTSNQNKKRRFNQSEEKPEENRHMYFFRGVLPSLIGFDEDQTLEFQTGVLSVIRNIKASRVNSNSAYTISSTSAPNRSPEYASPSPLAAKLEFDSQPNSPGSPPNTQQ
nr:unnamed protein product [Callosobruchus chinensis]